MKQIIFPQVGLFPHIIADQCAVLSSMADATVSTCILTIFFIIISYVLVYITLPSHAPIYSLIHSVILFSLYYHRFKDAGGKAELRTIHNLSQVRSCQL